MFDRYTEESGRMNYEMFKIYVKELCEASPGGGDDSDDSYEKAMRGMGRY